MVLFDIPSDVCLEIISEWIEIDQKFDLDLACCSTRHRPYFLHMLTRMQRIKTFTLLDPAIHLWMHNRRLDVRNLVLDSTLYKIKAGVFTLSIPVNKSSIEDLYINTDSVSTTGILAQIGQLIGQFDALTSLICKPLNVVPLIPGCIFERLTALKLQGCYYGDDRDFLDVIKVYCRELRTLIFEEIPTLDEALWDSFSLFIVGILSLNPFLNIVEVYGKFSMLCECAAQHCKNVVEFGVHVDKVESLLPMTQVFKECKQLGTMYIQSESFNSAFSNKDKSLFIQSSEFRELHLSEFVQCFSNLKQFTVTDMNWNTRSHYVLINDILDHSATSLLGLSFAWIPNGDDSNVVRSVLQRCPNLTSLELLRYGGNDLLQEFTGVSNVLNYFEVATFWFPLKLLTVIDIIECCPLLESCRFERVILNSVEEFNERLLKQYSLGKKLTCCVLTRAFSYVLNYENRGVILKHGNEVEEYS